MGCAGHHFLKGGRALVSTHMQAQACQPNSHCLLYTAMPSSLAHLRPAAQGGPARSPRTPHMGHMTWPCLPFLSFPHHTSCGSSHPTQHTCTDKHTYTYCSCRRPAARAAEATAGLLCAGAPWASGSGGGDGRWRGRRVTSSCAPVLLATHEGVPYKLTPKWHGQGNPNKASVQIRPFAKGLCLALTR